MIARRRAGLPAGPATARDRFLGRLENWARGITVSPDGKTILYSKEMAAGSDLVLIENFR